MTLVEVSAEAELFKQEANEYFKGIFLFKNIFVGGDFDKAIASYTKAIEIHESAVYLANRSFAYLRTECFGYALEDATKAIELDPSYIKVYFIRCKLIFRAIIAELLLTWLLVNSTMLYRITKWFVLYIYIYCVFQS